jgi:exonuclease VII small subunit
MRFNEACRVTQAEHQTTNGAFRRALFTVLKDRCKLASFAEVADRFGFSEDEVPVDDITQAPEIVSELEAASAELEASQQKLAAAMAKREAAERRLERIEELRSDLPRLRESLAFVKSMPERLQAVIDGGEHAIREHVYSLPQYSVIGDSVSFLLARQQQIEAARAALAAHPARLEAAQAVLDGVQDEIKRLLGKGGKKKG